METLASFIIGFKDIFQMTLVVFLTYGASLDEWKNTGLLTREIKLYRSYQTLAGK